MPLLNEKIITDIINAAEAEKMVRPKPMTKDDGEESLTKIINQSICESKRSVDKKHSRVEFDDEQLAIDIPPENVQVERSGLEKRRWSEQIPAFGLLMAFLSIVCFSFASLIVKLVSDLHSIEILLVRALFQMVFYFTATVSQRHPFFGQPGHRIDLLMRALSGTVSLTSIYMAYRLMPFADASTIHFASPVFVTIFAFFLLKEKINVLQAITGSITLIGVVIIAKPEFLFGPPADSGQTEYPNRLTGTILATVAALSAAFSMINIRKLKTTPPSVIVMWFGLSVVTSSCLFLYLTDNFLWPTGLVTWLLLMASGLCGIGDQYFLCLSLKYESAGPVSVTRTLNIVLSFVWEVTILKTDVEWTSLLGAGLITFCVLILALVKCRQENPKLFVKIRNKVCCFCRSKKNVDRRRPQSVSLTPSLRASKESLDSGIVQSTVHSNITNVTIIKD